MRRLSENTVYRNVFAPCNVRPSTLANIWAYLEFAQTQMCLRYINKTYKINKTHILPLTRRANKKAKINEGRYSPLYSILRQFSYNWFSSDLCNSLHTIDLKLENVHKCLKHIVFLFQKCPVTTSLFRGMALTNV